MAYKIYRNVKIIEVKTEKVTPNLRPYDISGDTFQRDSYQVQKVEFSNYQSASFSDLGKYIRTHETVSVAINEHLQLIAIVNHTTGKSGKAFENQKENLKEHLSALIYIVPIAAFGIWLLWKSLSYFQAGNEVGFIPAGFGAGALALAIFILRRYGKESKEPGNALKELLSLKK